MIYEFATKVALRFSHKQYIPSDEIDLVTYGLFSAISKIMYGIISLIMGIIFGCIIESMYFYICFLFIKKYVGGFHAKTELRCFFLSTFSIAISVLIINLSERFMLTSLVVLCLSVVSYILIAIYAPAPSKERPLDEEECKRYSNISKIRIVILIAISLLTYILEYKNVCISISAAVILSSILLVAGKRKPKKIQCKIFNVQFCI